MLSQPTPDDADRVPPLTHTHLLSRADCSYTCSRCGWSWRSRPTSACPGLPRYPTWGSIPATLLTRTRLRKAGLKPSGPPQACIAGLKEWHWFYDRACATPLARRSPAHPAFDFARAAGYPLAGGVPPSPDLGERVPWTTERHGTNRTRQTQHLRPVAEELAAYEEELAAAEEEREEIAQRLEDAEAAKAWATHLLARSDWRILAIETTGLDPHGAEIIALSITDHQGHLIAAPKIRPLIPIPAEITALTGIGDADVAGRSYFLHLADDLASILRGGTVVAFNAEFDRAMIEIEYRRLGLEPPRCTWECAMAQYAAWFGDWSPYHGDYRWQPLPDATHDPTGDCRAVLRLLERMAGKATGRGPFGGTEAERTDDISTAQRA